MNNPVSIQKQDNTAVVFSYDGLELALKTLYPKKYPTVDDFILNNTDKDIGAIIYFLFGRGMGDHVDFTAF